MYSCDTAGDILFPYNNSEGTKVMTIKERFWSKTKVSDRHEWGGTKCIDWTAYRKPDGYGSFSIKTKPFRAHRVAFEWANGEIPEGLCVCHRCDRPSCVNPDHLFLGTSKENAEDMTIKGRRARGEKNGQCKTSEDTVRLIKRFLERHPPKVGRNGGQLNFISRWLGVARSTVSHISTGEKWRHVQ